jgi:4-hydroxyphenylacetate 3-monooxygenase oxygenase component
MGIRTGKDYVSSLRDGRQIYVAGSLVSDVTEYRPFQRILQTVAGLYDMQQSGEYRHLLSFPSPTSGDDVSLSFMMAKGEDDVRRIARAYETWADESCGLLGRNPHAVHAYVTGFAEICDLIGKREKRFGENILKYHEYVRENDLYLTHVLVDPQVDRSRGPAEQDDPFLTLGIVEENEKGIVVRGAKMLSTSSPLANEIFVGPYLPRKPDEWRYALCFAIPVATKGLKFICREPYDDARSLFDRPLTSRFDEQDAMAIFEDVLVPWDRIFVKGDVEIFNLLLPSGSRYVALQAMVRTLAKLKFIVGLAYLVAEAIGRSEVSHCQVEIGKLVSYYTLASGMLAAGIEEVAKSKGRTPQTLFAFITTQMPDIQMRANEILSALSSSGMVMTPTEKDLGNQGVADHLMRYLRGKSISGRDRIQLFKLVWDFLGEQFGSRQALYESYYAGDPMVHRATLFRKFDAEPCKARVRRLLGKKT